MSCIAATYVFDLLANLDKALQATLGFFALMLVLLLIEFGSEKDKVQKIKFYLGRLLLVFFVVVLLPSEEVLNMLKQSYCQIN